MRRHLGILQNSSEIYDFSDNLKIKTCFSNPFVCWHNADLNKSDLTNLEQMKWSMILKLQESWRILLFFDWRLPSFGTTTCRIYDSVSDVTIKTKGLNRLVVKDYLALPRQRPLQRFDLNSIQKTTALSMKRSYEHKDFFFCLHNFIPVFFLWGTWSLAFRLWDVSEESIILRKNCFNVYPVSVKEISSVQ